MLCFAQGIGRMLGGAGTFMQPDAAYQGSRLPCKLMMEMT